MGKREASDYAVEMLNRVGIPDAARRIKSFPHQFSGGMRQRIMFATDFAVQSSLLIATNPLRSGRDAGSTNK
jgi:ABC-type dipeptide/oligopeptide/nickel transport system ATPase component